MITINPKNCSGCIRCEVNCSFFHTGRVGRSRARVKVVKIEDIGIDYPVICRQCEERYCTKCPESAIEIGPEGQMIVTPTLCTSCGTCETLCPIGAIELYEGIPYVCDLCGGKPRCVEQCNMGAINYESEHDEPASLKTFKKSSKGLNPEEKRVLYALDRARELLDQWKSTVGG